MKTKLTLPTKIRECKVWARTLHKMGAEALELLAELPDDFAPEMVDLLTDVANYGEMARAKAEEAWELLESCEVIDANRRLQPR